MEEIIVAIILGAIALGCYIIGCLQFLGKGFLLNNAFIYASEEEREKMDKKPYYLQSGIVFCVLGTVFLLNAIYAVMHKSELFICVIALIVLAIIYAIVSSVIIESKKNKH